MIIYDLNCDAGHRFEGWFKKQEDFAEQKTEGLLSCPVCGSAEVKKLPTASRVNTRSSLVEEKQERATTPEQSLVAADIVQKLHRYVDKNFIDVGVQFPEEARKIHYGETEARNIRGTATREEVRDLHKEGVEILPIPPKPVDKEKLN